METTPGGEPKLRFRGSNRSLRPRRCAGVASLELVLVLPILLIFLAATIEFGIILANLKYLPMASRAGAQVVAKDKSAALVDVEAAVNQTLSACGATACGVTVKHNVGTNYSVSTGTCADSGPAFSAMPTDGSGSVSVTVTVRVSDMAPDLLDMFGFSLSGRLATSTTIFPYEGP